MADYYVEEEDEYDDESIILPNGYSKLNYFDVGFSEEDIECWGLDQPDAPSPFEIGFVLGDMFDGEIDGEIRFPII